ncbi:platelet-derived growth factor D isoform X4 [Cynocephalus volans]|uniref:platelet-derived growth factor D isoform X4 n=1 Tax=Cynocephalus volans TaxID=110931 RepID=UPI002FCC9A41
MCYGLAHNGHLGARVNKSLQRMPIHFAVDIEHHYLSETLRSLFHRYGHVFFNVLLSDVFLYFGLSVPIEWVSGIETKPLLLPQGAFPLLLHQDLRKRLQVAAEQRFCQAGVAFLQQGQMVGIGQQHAAEQAGAAQTASGCRLRSGGRAVGLRRTVLWPPGARRRPGHGRAADICPRLLLSPLPRPRPHVLLLKQNNDVTVLEAVGAQGAVVIREESLHVDDLDLLGRDAGLELAEDAEIAELEVRADLQGEGHLGEVPPHTVHGDQHGMGPGGPGGQRAEGGSLAGWSWSLLVAQLLLTTWGVAGAHSPLIGTDTHQSGGCHPASVPAAGPVEP